MPIFYYKARDEAGRLINGEMESDNIKEVKRNLRGKNVYPIDINAKHQANDVPTVLFRPRISSDTMAVFCRQFSTLIRAGVPIVTCLNILSGQTDNLKLNDSLCEIYDDLRRGVTLSGAMKRYPQFFPTLLVSMIEAGETGGNLDFIMDKMAVHYENQSETGRKVRSAVIYPAVVACVAAGVVIFLMAFVLPEFIGLFESAGAVLPLPTRILINISSVIRKYWYIFLAAAGGVYAFFKSYTSRAKGRAWLDKLKLTLPVIGKLNKEIITARFTRTLGMLIESGVPLLKSIAITDNIIDNRVVKEAMKDISADVAKGSGLAWPLRKSGIFSPMVYQMVEVGESSGTLDDMLFNIADFFDREVEASTTQLTNMMEPALTLFMAVIVGFIVIAIALPMFQMMNLVGY
jgi:type IV pilus assembly protein PilC